MAKEHVAQEVNSCQNDDEMDELGKMYHNHHIRVCESPLTVIAFFLMVSWQSRGTKAPPLRRPPIHPALLLKIERIWLRPRFVNLLETIAMPSKMWEPRPKIHGYSHFEYETISKALIRDDYRCAITGKYDARSVRKNLEPKKEVLKTNKTGVEVVYTQCAHIFPASINNNISGSNECGSKVRLMCTLFHRGYRLLSVSLARVCSGHMGYPEVFR
jgi:hypothetical protein